MTDVEQSQSPDRSLRGRGRRPIGELKADDDPSSQLPVVISDAEGDIRIVLGPFDLATLAPQRSLDAARYGTYATA